MATVSTGSDDSSIVFYRERCFLKNKKSRKNGEKVGEEVGEASLQKVKVKERVERKTKLKFLLKILTKIIDEMRKYHYNRNIRLQNVWRTIL